MNPGEQSRSTSNNGRPSTGTLNYRGHNSVRFPPLILEPEALIQLNTFTDTIAVQCCMNLQNVALLQQLSDQVNCGLFEEIREDVLCKFMLCVTMWKALNKADLLTKNHQCESVLFSLAIPWHIGTVQIYHISPRHIRVDEEWVNAHLMSKA